MFSANAPYIPTLFLLLLSGCSRVHPLPSMDSENPSDIQSQHLATLGRHLFFDVRLSANQTKSCSSCHDPQFAFTDTYRRSSGLYGDQVQHNAPSLLNTRFLPALGWANPTLNRYEDQILGPLFRDDPPEMGLRNTSTPLPSDAIHAPTLEVVLSRLASDSLYIRLFEAAFPRANKRFMDTQAIAAMAAYQRQLVSFNAPYDRFRAGDSTALSDEAIRGMYWFFSDLFSCGSCHPAPLFTDGKYYNIGLYNEDQDANHPGVFFYTHQKADMGLYRSPSLRNVALTAPYFHDGSVATLSEAITVFEQGGKPHPNKCGWLYPITCNTTQRYELLAFLNTLTDSTIFVNPWFQDPF